MDSRNAAYILSIFHYRKKANEIRLSSSQYDVGHGVDLATYI
jgi:hypothetical protein